MFYIFLIGANFHVPGQNPQNNFYVIYKRGPLRANTSGYLLDLLAVWAFYFTDRYYSKPPILSMKWSLFLYSVTNPLA